MNEQNAREWYFYRDLESLKVRVDCIDTKQLQITFQRSDGIEVGECPNCQEDEDSQLLSSVALYFYIEEIPRLIAILNDIYRAHYDTCVPFLKLDDEDDYCGFR